MSPVDHLGRGWSDPAVQRVIADWRDRPYIDGESIQKAVVDGRLSLFNLERGMFLFFTDAVSYMARFGLAKSEGPIMVSRVVFFGAYHADVDAYEGAVVGDLTMRARLDAWIDALGHAEWTHEVAGVIRKARWLVDGAQADVSFTPSGECKLVSLTLQYTPEADAMRAEAQACAQVLRVPCFELPARGILLLTVPYRSAN